MKHVGEIAPEYFFLHRSEEIGSGRCILPLLKPAGALEVLAHRIVWPLVLMAAVLVGMRRLSDIGRIDRRTWLLLVCASALVSGNWVIYVYAVNNGHVVDAALGYFINPLVSVLLGVVIFHERLNHAQIAQSTGWSESSVESLIVRAYSSLRLGLKEWANE